MTRPLTAHALGVLQRISREPVQCQEVNAGVSHKLINEKLATVVMLPSPYAIHRGGNIGHLMATPLGVARLHEEG